MLHWIFGVLLVVIVATLALSYVLCRMVLYPAVNDSDETRRVEIEKGRFDPAEYESWPKEEVSLTSAGAYLLKGVYIPFDAAARRTVIFSHGHTWSFYGMLKYAVYFRRRGYNLLLYDLRYHGKSGGKNCTFGYYERDDLRLMVDWALARLGPGGQVALMGESLGAAVCLLEAGSDERPAFVVADCPFSDLKALLTYQMRHLFPWLPVWPFLPLAELFCRVLSGMRFEELSPLRAVANMQMPLFLIHGLEDRYIPTEMSRALYAAKTEGLRRLYLAPQARHARSLDENREMYARELNLFLDDVEKII